MDVVNAIAQDDMLEKINIKELVMPQQHLMPLPFLRTK